jgi:hypothetical protein
MRGTESSFSIDPAVLEHYELDNLGYLPGARRHVLLEQFRTISNLAINSLLRGINPGTPLQLEPLSHTENRPYHFPLVAYTSKHVKKGTLKTKTIDENTMLVATAYHDSAFSEENRITDQKGIYAIDLNVSYKTPISVTLNPYSRNNFPRFHDKYSVPIPNVIISEFIGIPGDTEDSRIWTDTRYSNDSQNNLRTVAARALWVALLDPSFKHPNIK